MRPIYVIVFQEYDRSGAPELIGYFEDETDAQRFYELFQAHSTGKYSVHPVKNLL